MKCKHCNNELDPGILVCPHCGTDNGDAQPVESAQKAEKGKLILMVCGIAAVALLGVGLIMITLFGVKGGWEKTETTQTLEADPTTLPGATTQPGPTEYVPGEGFLKHQSYTVDQDKADAMADEVIATVGEYGLTNRQAQMYYWMQFYDVWNYYYSQYGGYTPYYINLDYTQPFQDQAVPGDTMNWDQYLMESAVHTWHRYQVLAQLARDKGYTVDEEILEQLEETNTAMNALAQENNLQSADELIAREMGEGVTMKEYLGYLELYLLGEKYFAELYAGIPVTDEQIETYFAENIEDMELQGITKESGNVADVRHILIIPEGGTQTEDSYYLSYTDAEWAAGLARAQAVLDEWKAGEATEASFAALTGKYTEDTGYESNGGLYLDILADSNYVTNFKNWAVSADRKQGDCEIVQTEYGYHVMYLVNTEVAWVRFAREGYKSEYCSDVINAAAEQLPVTIDYDRIGIASVSFE